MDLLLSLVLSAAPVPPVNPAAAVQPATALDIELAQAVLTAEHRLSVPLFVLMDSDSWKVVPVGIEPR
jgi:hypothetical protein